MKKLQDSIRDIKEEKTRRENQSHSMIEIKKDNIVVSKKIGNETIIVEDLSFRELKKDSSQLQIKYKKMLEELENTSHDRMSSQETSRVRANQNHLKDLRASSQKNLSKQKEPQTNLNLYQA